MHGVSLKTFAVAVLLAGAAHASGFYLGDNGGKALAQGGAFTAQADDLSAIQHNPAGLAQLDGWTFLADVQLINHDVTWLRQDNGFDPANPPTPACPSRTETVPGCILKVQNKGGIFLLPFIGGSYGFKLFGRTATIGLGVYGPPSVGRYAFEQPNYEKNMSGAYLESPRRFAPQRYVLIKNDIIILYPSLSLSYAVHPRFMLGASAQLVISQFSFRQALFAGDSLGINPMRQVDENPDYDALVDVNLGGRVGFTGIFGALAKPTDWLSVGASIRPPVPITAAGKLGITLNGLLAQAASVEGDQATLQLTLPLELRVGVRFEPMARLGINADFVYQGWNSVDALVLTPKDVFLVQGSMKTEVQQFRIEKQWRATYSGRLGASFDVIKYLTVHAGAMYETAAASDAHYAIDFAHPSRVLITAGATGHLGPVDVIATFMFAPTVSTTVTDSQVLRGQTDPNIVAGATGAGIYTSGGWTLGVGVRGRFPLKVEAPTPVEPSPAPAPAAPVTTPAPVEPAPAPATTTP